MTLRVFAVGLLLLLVGAVLGFVSARALDTPSPESPDITQQVELDVSPEVTCPHCGQRFGIALFSGGDSEGPGAALAAIRERAHRFIALADKDGDGRVTKIEWAGDAGRFDLMDENHDGYLDLDEAPRGRTGFIPYFDLDGDGVVSRQEFTGPETRFVRMDVDGDGVIDAGEVGQSPSAGAEESGDLHQFHSDERGP